MIEKKSIAWLFTNFGVCVPCMKSIMIGAWWTTSQYKTITKLLLTWIILLSIRTLFNGSTFFIFIYLHDTHQHDWSNWWWSDFAFVQCVYFWVSSFFSLSLFEYGGFPSQHRFIHHIIHFDFFLSACCCCCCWIIRLHWPMSDVIDVYVCIYGREDYYSNGSFTHHHYIIRDGEKW